MNVADFDFELPETLIAQEPPSRREDSRLLVLPRHGGDVVHTTFAHVGDHLRPGDLLVLNNTKVFAARLLGRREPSGGAVECLLIGRLGEPQPAKGVVLDTRLNEPPWLVGSVSWRAPRAADRYAAQPPVIQPSQNSRLEPHTGLWDALVHPGQKLKPGSRVVFERDGMSLQGEVLERHFHGRRTIRLWADTSLDLDAVIDRVGHVPLPPYIKREDRLADRDRYQTVFATERGSVAAPTAGLHFTQDLLAGLAARGVERTEVTLHVGYGTFKPVRVERVEDHEVDPEMFTVTDAAAEALTRARRQGRRIIAVGTTTARALESLAIDHDGRIEPASGQTRLFIRPGYEFRIVGALITNFHLPRSSLLMLVAAFVGRDRLLAAYREAIERRYRFYSYGDAMLIA